MPRVNYCEKQGYLFSKPIPEEEANQEYPFKQVILELMEESDQKLGPFSQIYDFIGKQFLLEVRYLAHDQKSQRDAFVYTFEGLAK